VLALALLCSNASTLGKALRNSDLTAADYSTFFVAGKLLDAGRAHQLYDLAAQAGMHLNPRFQQVPLPFNHGAYEAILFAPLARLPYLASYAVWDLCSLALLAWMAWRLRPWLDGLIGIPFLLIFTVALVYWPNAMVLLQGQDSILLAALVTEVYVQLKSGREEWAGVVLALGLFKFHLVLPLLACFALNRQWRLVKSFTATAAALAALSFAMIGSGGVADYIKLMRSLNVMPLAAYTKPAQMPNLRGLLAYALTSSPPVVGRMQWIVPTVLVGSVVVLFAVVRILPGNDREEKFNLFFSCATAVTYALSFNTYEHDMAIMFPGLLLAANFGVKQRSLGWRLACAAALVVLFVPAVYLQLYFHRALALMCLPILLLVGLLSCAPDR
jgi:hypothetical protein